MVSTLFYLISIAFSFILFLLLNLLHYNSPKKNSPAGPPSLPIIGHLHLLKDPVHRTLEALSKKYGPIFTLRFGSRRVLILSSPSAVEKVFTENDVVFANRPRFQAGEYISYNYTLLGSAQYGDHWRNLRRLLTLEIFSTGKLNFFATTRQEEVGLLLKDIFQNSRDSFFKVEMNSRLADVSFNIITRILARKRFFGSTEVEDSVEEATEFRHTIRDIQETCGSLILGDFVPLWGWIASGKVEKQMLKIQRKMDGFLQGLVEDGRRKDKEVSDQKGGETKSMLDSMLELQESDPQYYSDDIIKGIMLTLLIAGTDTSTVAIEWAMSLLLNHPKVLDKARAELDKIVGGNRLVDETDLSKLPYLQSIINETLRLFPPTPIIAPHESSDNCTIEGQEVARGTMLLINAWAIHRDPMVWEDPASFKPERFESEENNAYRLIPFGVGRRSCPGLGIANRVMGLALATLIQCFEWERIGEELVDMSEGKGITMPKAKPLEVMFKARKTMINVLSEL